MKAAFLGVLSLAGLVLGYFALLWGARRFFTGRYRPETAAAAVIAAFILGASVPRYRSPAAGVASPPAAAFPVVSPTAVDASTACSTAHLTKGIGKGHIDTVGVQARSDGVTASFNGRLHVNDLLVLSGWAAEPQIPAPAASVCVLVDGKIAARAKILYGSNRPDVATAYHNAALAATGFSASVSAATLAPGPHRIQAALVAADGSAAVLPGDVQVELPR